MKLNMKFEKKITLVKTGKIGTTGSRPISAPISLQYSDIRRLAAIGCLPG